MASVRLPLSSEQEVPFYQHYLVANLAVDVA